ncbi:MAG: hypothetical protein ACLRQF_12220 [Thomasclavelia ramosa]
MTYVLMFYFIANNGWRSYQSLTNPDYFIAVFQTGWFIESMWSQILVIHLIRTAKVPFIQVNLPICNDFYIIICICFNAYSI